MNRIELTWSLALGLCAFAAPADAGTPPLVLEIFDIQGNGLVSPHVGTQASLAENVVTAVMADGYYLQTPDARADSDTSLTSNGLRVQTSSAPVYAAGAPVLVGHRLNTAGVISEVGGETRLISAQLPERIGSGVEPMPMAIEFSVASGRPRARADNLSCFNGLSNFECFEGMRVHLPTGRVAGGNASSDGDPWGPVQISPFGERSFREKGVRFGDNVQVGNELAGIWDGNPEVLRMDADRLGAIPAGSAIAGGAAFSATGVLTVADGDYALWPQTLSFAGTSNQLPVALPLPGSADVLRLASFDLGALCDAVVGNTPLPCAIPEPDAAQLTQQRSRLTDYVVDVLRSPAILAVQNVENQNALAALASSMSARTGGTYLALMIEGNDSRGLDLGFLVDTARVSAPSVSQLAALEIDPTQPGFALHRQPPLLLIACWFVAAWRVSRARTISMRSSPSPTIVGALCRWPSWRPAAWRAWM